MFRLVGTIVIHAASRSGQAGIPCILLKDGAIRHAQLFIVI